MKRLTLLFLETMKFWQFILLFAAFTLFSENGYAQQNTQEDAEEIAIKFVVDRSHKSRAEIDTKMVQLAYTDKAITPAYYVFNTNNGYLIVSGDKRTNRQILGYADNGEFDYDNTSDHLKLLLQNYADEIEELRAGPTMLDEKELEEETTPFPIVEPLIKSHWHQEYPANMFMPECEDLEYKWTPYHYPYHYWAGCGTIAMAAFMHYWKWPENAEGYGYLGIEGEDAAETIRYDFNTNYDWDSMLNEYGKWEFNEDTQSGVWVENNYSEREAAALATLIKDCAYSINSTCSLIGTSCGMESIQRSLGKTFSYKEGTIEPKDNNIISELDKGNPVIVSGFGDTNGHAFICDGYDSEGYFHFNMGWGGKDDGYYLTNSITNSQHIKLFQHLIGVEPNFDKASITNVITTTPTATGSYDLQGRKIISSQHGIIIKNGKKAMN